MQNPLIIPFGKTDPGNIELLGAKGAKLTEDYRDLREIFPGTDEQNRRSGRVHTHNGELAPFQSGHTTPCRIPSLRPPSLS